MCSLHLVHWNTPTIWKTSVGTGKVRGESGAGRERNSRSKSSSFFRDRFCEERIPDLSRYFKHSFLSSFLVLWTGAITKWPHTKDWQDAEQYPHNTKKHPLEVPPRMYIFITNIKDTNFFSCHDFIRVWNSAFNCRVQTPLEIALTPVLCTLRWCYTGRFATTIFSVTLRCNVGTML